MKRPLPVRKPGTDRRGEEGWTSPMAVVRDGSLPLDAKRAILIDWAWTEYLIDQAVNKEARRMAGLRAFTRSNLPCWLSNVATLRRRATRLRHYRL